MALTKGFLRPNIAASSTKIQLGVAIGTVSSLLLYFFFYYFRESLRILTGYFTHTLLVELTPRENFYYNLFYGSIAAVLGFYAFAHFVLSTSVTRENARQRIRQRQILNDLSFVGWTFLSGFTRFTSLLGIFFLSLPLQFDINFLDEFSLLLILIPVVLYLNAWTLIVKTFGRQAYRWFLYATAYLSVLSVGYANINFIDYQQVDQNTKAYGGEWAHDIMVPPSESHEMFQMRSSLAMDIYLDGDSAHLLTPILHWDFARNEIELSQVKTYVAQEQFRLDSSERDRLEAVLRIDQRVPLSVVNQLKQELRMAGVTRMNYSTGVKHTKYPTYYPLYHYLGIPQRLPPYYPVLDVFLDSAERLDPSKYRVRLVESDMYRLLTLKKMNRVLLTVDPNRVYLNGTPVTAARLTSILYTLTKRYAPDFMIRYAPDEAISYGRYVEYLGLMYHVTDRLRSEAIGARYDYPRDCWRHPEECEAVEAMYPRNVVEWTPEEKRLDELISN